MKVIDRTTFKFVIVGIINTLLGNGIMFFMYNFMKINYWYSSISNYIIGSIISYFLNKYYTFQYKKKEKCIIIKFIINILCCYIIAYGLIKKIIFYFFFNYLSNIVIENISMFVGMCSFIILNYFGQKFYVFKK